MEQKSESNDMGMNRPLFGGANSVAEFVTPGHPDKACDQIAGRILDLALKENPNARVGIEMVATKGILTIGGELSPEVINKINVENAARHVFERLGYTSDKYPIEINNIINEQSEDIAEGVNRTKDEVSAGDQGIMCGYAIHAPEREHMPAAVWYAQRLAIKLYEVVKNKTIPNLYTDGKTQVIIKDGKINHVTIAIHHEDVWGKDSNGKTELTEPIYDHVIKPVVGELSSIIVNGTGKFTKGSIWADSAEVGRKIVIDQMGPDIPVGGGAMCGKDPSKVDLTGAVMARHIAKNIVANKLANEVLVQFAFTIGQYEPDLINIYAPGWKGEINLEDWCRKHFPTRVSDMINHLQLNQPEGWSYEEAAQFGFYGHSQFPWEKIVSAKS